MKDFKQAKADAVEANRLTSKVETYLERVQGVLTAVDDAVGAAEAVEHDGQPGYWIPANEFRGLKDAYELAW